MPFRFPLAAVLLVREHAEQREERALRKIQLEIAHASRQVEELNAEIAGMQLAREQAMRQPIPAFELQAYARKVEEAAEKKQALLDRIQTLRVDLGRQMKAYQACHRDREALTDMLRARRDAYDQEQARAQQKSLDDMFTARRRRDQADFAQRTRQGLPDRSRAALTEPMSNEISPLE